MNTTPPVGDSARNSADHATLPFRPAHLLVLALVASTLLYAVNVGDFFFHDSSRAVAQNSDIRISGRFFDEWRTAAMGTETGPLGRSVSMLSFAANHALSGEVDAVTIKLTNVLIHALSGLFLYLFLCLVLQRSPVLALASDSARLIAAVAAAIWLLHPLQVSTVMYSVQRMTQLAALFAFAGLWHLFLLRVRWLDAPPGVTDYSRILLVGLLWTALAALSKENGLLLPLLAVATELTLFRCRAAGGSLALVRAVSVGALLVACLLLICLPLLASDTFAAWYAMRDFSMGERLLTQPRLLWHYLGWIVLPDITAMGFNHDDIALSHGLLAPFTTLVAIIAFVALGILAWLHRNRWPLLGFALLWFLSGHLLESSIFPLEMSYEHRNYLPMVGPVVLLAGSALLLAGERAGLLRMCLVIYVLALLPLLYLRAATWSNELSLAQAQYRDHPQSPKSAFHLATAYYDAALVQPDTVLAQQYFAASRAAALKSLEYRHDYVPALAWLILMDSRSSDTTRVEEWRRRLRTAIDKPVLSFSDMRSVIAVNQCVRQGLCPEPEGGQEAFLRTLVGLHPGQLHLRVELAMYCLGAGRLDCAEAEAEDALAIEPRFLPALEVLYRIELKAGRSGDVMETGRRLMNVDEKRRFTRRLLMDGGSSQ